MKYVVQTSLPGGMWQENVQEGFSRALDFIATVCTQL